MVFFSDYCEARTEMVLYIDGEERVGSKNGSSSVIIVVHGSPKKTMFRFLGVTVLFRERET